MDFFEQIEKIKQLLKANGYLEFADRVTDAQMVGGTGGEVLISVCAQLLDIRRNAPVVYSVIENMADSLIKYANSIGLYPR